MLYEFRTTLRVFWGDRHHPKWLDIVRIGLGIFLCIKGVEFLNNMGSLMGLITNKLSFNNFALIMLSHYVVFAHLMGGFLLAIGLLTRFALYYTNPHSVGSGVSH